MNSNRFGGCCTLNFKRTILVLACWLCVFKWNFFLALAPVWEAKLLFIEWHLTGPGWHSGVARFEGNKSLAIFGYLLADSNSAVSDQHATGTSLQGAWMIFVREPKKPVPKRLKYKNYPRETIESFSMRTAGKWVISTKFADDQNEFGFWFWKAASRNAMFDGEQKRNSQSPQRKLCWKLKRRNFIWCEREKNKMNKQRWATRRETAENKRNSVRTVGLITAMLRNKRLNPTNNPANYYHLNCCLNSDNYHHYSRRCILFKKSPRFFIVWMALFEKDTRTRSSPNQALSRALNSDTEQSLPVSDDHKARGLFVNCEFESKRAICFWTRVAEWRFWMRMLNLAIVRRIVS